MIKMREITKENILTVVKTCSEEELLDVFNSPYLTTPSIDGWTALHHIAYRTQSDELVSKIIKHPDLLLGNNRGFTPLQELIGKWVLTREQRIEIVQERFPWFEITSTTIVSRDLINKLVNTPNSVMFSVEE